MIHLLAIVYIRLRHTSLHEKVKPNLNQRKFLGGEPLYLVKWKGYSLDETTWEPPENLKKNVVFEKYLKEVTILPRFFFKSENYKEVSRF